MFFSWVNSDEYRMAGHIGTGRIKFKDFAIVNAILQKLVRTRIDRKMFIHFVLLSLSRKAGLSMTSCLTISADLASFSCHLAPPPHPTACCGPLFWMGWPPLAGWLGPGTSACSGASGWRQGSAQHS